MRRLLATGGSRARSVISTVAGQPLHHLEEGTGDPVIVLLHGGSGGGANWFRLLVPLSARCRVLAPDLPGFGLSAPQPPRAPIGRQAAGLLDEWLDRLDVARAVVVGTSFGGLAALRWAQQRPDRVAGLLLLNSAGLGRGIHPLVRVATLPGLTRLGVRPTRRGTATLFRRLLTTDRAELDRATESALIDYLYASARAAGTAYLARTLRLFVGPRGQREIPSDTELAAVRQPVVVAWGELDPFLPVADARSAAARFAHGTFIGIPDAGHSPNWERPRSVLAAIERLLT